MQRPRLAQPPAPPPAALAATGNVPLAAGCLGVSARVHGLTSRLELDVVPPSKTDVLGDALLAEMVSRDEPEFLGLSLYLWNCERSLPSSEGGQAALAADARLDRRARSERGQPVRTRAERV